MENKKDFLIYIIIFLFSFSYAVVRYDVFAGVPWSQLPFFIMNKVMAFSGTILLIITFTISPLKNLGVNIPSSWLTARKGMGITGFASIFVHVLINLLIFSPAYYGKFFDANNLLTLNAGLSMLSGVLAFVILWLYNISFFKPDKNIGLNKVLKSKGFLLVFLPLAAFHMFFMGYEGWLTPSKWQGGIPPISLVTFSLFFTGYILNIVGRK